MTTIGTRNRLVIAGFIVAFLAITTIPVFNTSAYADDFTVGLGEPATMHECSKGNQHNSGHILLSPTPYFNHFCEASSVIPEETTINILGEEDIRYTSHTVEPSDVVSVEKNTLYGETVLRTTALKAGTAALTINFRFSDGCTLAYRRSIQVNGCPFDIKKSYALKVGGDPIVIKYTGDKEGKLELSSWGGYPTDAGPLFKVSFSDQDATMIIEALRMPVDGDHTSINLTTYEREIGDDIWPRTGERHTINVTIDDGNSKEPATPVEKQTKALDSQSLRAYTSLLYPFYIQTQGAFSLNTAAITSSNPGVADASYTSGTLRINGKKAGTTTLTIKADKAIYNYTMEVTVNAVPIKSENIKANDTGIKFATMLGGKNVPEDAEAVIEAKKINSGNSYTVLKQAVKNDLIGVYSVNLGVDGKDVHDDFGTIDLTFPVPAGYTNTTVRVNHLHEATSEQFKAGEITTEIVPVVNGEATVTVSDLSTFALESSTTSAANNTGTGINGNNNTVGGSVANTNSQNTTQAGQSAIPGKNSAALSTTGDGGFAALMLLGMLAIAASASLTIMLARGKERAMNSPIRLRSVEQRTICP